MVSWLCRDPRAAPCYLLGSVYVDPIRRRRTAGAAHQVRRLLLRLDVSSNGSGADQLTPRDAPPSPSRVSEGAFALMTARDAAGDVRLLLQYNDGWQAFTFVGGHVDPEDVGRFERTAAREVQEETGIVPGIDFSLARLHAGVMEAVAFSRSAGVWTQYRHAFFLLVLHKTSWADVDFWQGDCYRWVGIAELQRGATADGATISEFPSRMLLARLNVRSLPASTDRSTRRLPCGALDDATSQPTEPTIPAVQTAMMIPTRNAGAVFVVENPAWGALTFPICKLRDTETPEQAARRLTTDPCELGLAEPPRIESLGTVALRQYSRRRRELTDYTHHVFRARLCDAAADAIASRGHWLTLDRLMGQTHDPQPVTVSPTVPATLFALQARTALPDAARPSLHGGSVRFIKALCNELVAAADVGLEALRAQTSTEHAVIAGKHDAKRFDVAVQDALMARAHALGHALCERFAISLELRVLGEESWMETRIGTGPLTQLDITLDPCDGSTNYQAYLDAPERYRSFLPKPDTGISIAAQIDGDPRYACSVATDVQTGTMYSAYRTNDDYVCRIDDREVDGALFRATRTGAPRINVPFYSHADVGLMARVTAALHDRFGTHQVYPGRSRASIVDLIRMLAGDCDAMVDIRALAPGGGATLRPWDVCGMIPFLEGIGWYLSDEDGRPVSWRAYDQPVCLIVARAGELHRGILDVVRGLREDG